MDLDPDFGYFPEPFKSYVVVDETDLAEANALFGHLGVKVVTSHRLLGGHIGLSKGLHEYVDEKVVRWKDYVARINIASVAPSQPQDAHVALTKCLACEWDYLQRVVPECGLAFEPVEESLRETFLHSGPVWWVNSTCLAQSKGLFDGSMALVIPSVKNDTVLSPQEFRDGLAMCYNKPLLKLPGSCDGCGAALSLDHGLNCAKGMSFVDILMNDSIYSWTVGCSAISTCDHWTSCSSASCPQP